MPQPRSANLLGQRLVITARARAAARRLVSSAGPQHLLLTWPGGVTAMPAGVHVPGEFSVIIGHVARCPVYADVRQLALFRERQMMVDAPESTPAARRPLLRMSAAR